MELKGHNHKNSFWLLPAISAVCVIVGTRITLLSYIAFVLIVASFFFLGTEEIICLLMFNLPMANIFKAEPYAQSFFTYVLLLYVLLHVVRTRRLPSKYLLFVFIIILTQLVTQAFDINKTIKLLAGLAFVYYVISEESIHDYDRIFAYYVLGVIVSSIVAFLDPGFLRISEYIQMKELGKAYGFGNVLRFSGMDTDPNYYSVNLIVSLCLIVIRIHKDNSKIVINIIEAVLLIAFATLTYSKSVIIMLVFPIFFFMYSNHQKKRIGIQALCLLTILGVLFYAFSGGLDFLSIIGSRFTNAIGNGTIDVLMTGRLTIWRNYFNWFADNPVYLVIGSGIGADLVAGKVTHNVYLEMIYFLGIIGSVVMYRLIRQVYKNSRKDISRNMLNYSVLVCILIMYIFLSELFYFDAPFHLLISLMVMNNNIETVSDNEFQYYSKRHY